MMAISRAGGVYVGLNPRYTPAELAYVLESTQPSLGFVVATKFSDDEIHERAKNARNLAGLQEKMPLEIVFSIDDLQRWAGALSPWAGAEDRGGRKAAVIVFTSGTTGAPKGAVLPHDGLMLASDVFASAVMPSKEKPRILVNLPINHVGAIVNLTLSCITRGGTLVFQEKFDAVGTLQLIERERINCWFQVPTIFHACLTTSDIAAADLSSLRSICVGGGPLPSPTLAALRKYADHAEVFVEYGQTEVMSTISVSPRRASDAVLTDTIGMFLPAFEARIVNGEGQPCQLGEVGEIQARGVCTMLGYLNNPQATTEAFAADGWLKTGDLAEYRDDGLVVLRGRLKEMIKSGGYNLYPREIEIALEAHPLIAEVAIVGIPDSKYGESAHAFIVPRKGAALDADELKIWCSSVLSNYKIPKSFNYVDQLPKLPNGKINRRLLADSPLEMF